MPVLGGFIGATAAGVTTTLGRGGSDYSASIFGVCTGATEIQIWTDVDGMLTADPRVIDGTRTVRATVLRRSVGAGLLRRQGPASQHHHSRRGREHSRAHPELHAARSGRNAHHRAVRSRSPTPLTAIACKRPVTVIDIVSTRMLMAHGFLRRLFEVFERHQTAVDVVTTSEVSVSVTIDDRRRLDAIVADLSAFAEVSTTGDMALVCAVGERLRTDPSLCAHVVGAFEDLPLRMVSQAGSRRNITVVLPEQHLVEAMSRLHERFCLVEVASDRTVNDLIRGRYQCSRRRARP